MVTIVIAGRASARSANGREPVMLRHITESALMLFFLVVVAMALPALLCAVLAVARLVSIVT